MTKHECAIVTAYTDISMLQGDDLKYLYDYLSSYAGRLVQTWELPAVALEYRDQIKQYFMNLCRNATDD